VLWCNDAKCTVQTEAIAYAACIVFMNYHYSTSIIIIIFVTIIKIF